MAVTVLDGLDAVRAAAGQSLGESSWHEITAEAVRQFLDATGAPADGGGDRVPPLLLVSLSNLLLPEILEVRGVDAGVNYGTGAIRFPAPVPVGGRVRARADLHDVIDVIGGVQTTILITIEAEGLSEPACTIESLSRWLGMDASR